MADKGELDFLNGLFDMADTSKLNVEELKPYFSVVSVKKGDLLQRSGDHRTSNFYVRTGLLRSYIIDVKGKEHIYMFAPENWVIGDVGEVNSADGATLYIDALEDSELIRLHKGLFEFVQENHPEWVGNGALKLSRRVAVLQKRVLMLMSAPAKERYAHFLERYPDIVQRVPQKMIASYLGITPEALSTIRRQA